MTVNQCLTVCLLIPELGNAKHKVKRGEEPVNLPRFKSLLLLGNFLAAEK